MSKLRGRVLPILMPSQKILTLLTVSHGPISQTSDILSFLSFPTSFKQSDLCANSNFSSSLHLRVLNIIPFPQVKEQSPYSHAPHPVGAQWLGQSLSWDHLSCFPSTLAYKHTTKFRPFTPKRSKRGSVLKVRGNYRFKLYKWLNVATKTVVANSSRQNLKNEACYVSVL